MGKFWQTLNVLCQPSLAFLMHNDIETSFSMSVYTYDTTLYFFISQNLLFFSTWVSCGVPV
jgi:hypothetical protein